MENPSVSPSAMTPDRPGRSAAGSLVPPAVAPRPAAPSLAGLVGASAGAAAPMPLGLQAAHGGGWGTVMQHQREEHNTAVARRAATWLAPARPVDVSKMPPHEVHQARQHAALDDRVDRLLFDGEVEPVGRPQTQPRPQSSRGAPPALPTLLAARPSLAAMVPSAAANGNGNGHGNNAMFGTGAVAAGRWSAVGHAALAARGFEVTTRPPV